MPDAPSPATATAGVGATPRRPSWLRGWRALALTTVAVVLLAVLAVAVWLNDDSDLRAVDARARAMQVALTWEKLDRPAASAERVAAWTRAAAIAASLPRWESSSATPPRRLPHVGEPVSPGLVAHVAGLDAPCLADLDAALDEIGDEPLASLATADAPPPLPETGETQRIVKLERERILADPPDRVAADALRALRCAPCAARTRSVRRGFSRSWPRAARS